MMKNSKKFRQAITALKSTAQYTYGGDINTEEDFNKIEWVTGIKEDGMTAITSTTNPHAELTWLAVNTKMDELLAEYDAQDYARKRKSAYPDIYDYMDGIVKDDQTQINKYIADSQAVKVRYPKGG